MEELKRAYRNGFYSFKGLFGFLRPQVYILLQVVNPILQVICFSLMAKYAYGDRDITVYVLGNAMVLCYYDAFFGVGNNLITERSYDTLKLLLASPSSTYKLVFTKGSFYIVNAFFMVLVGICTGVLLFNLRISATAIPYLLLCLICAIFTACSMGMFIGAIGLVTRDINLLLNLCSNLLMCLCGINFPTEKLPLILRYISNVLPLTNALKAAKYIIENAALDYSKVNYYIFREFILGTLYCVIAYITIKFMEKLSKVKATIDIF
ncbi:ABC transporter permease [Clostridium sp. 19966]|uniref:ABC transporter permease n=1 Tax=Clostridium sp. 19966 TaxID=2768166 RepID=UPI0028DE7B46|nr:ABC transporter permease [Clostridium sp. 19966]MDT8716000.1 ABC transporter permease [Clostridium sp. 19966]